MGHEGRRCGGGSGQGTSSLVKNRTADGPALSKNQRRGAPAKHCGEQVSLDNAFALRAAPGKSLNEFEENLRSDLMRLYDGPHSIKLISDLFG